MMLLSLDALSYSVSPRKTHLIFTTSNPPTIQRMPWPQDEEGPSAQQRACTYDTWILNEDDFGWLKEPDGDATPPFPLARIPETIYSWNCEDYQRKNDGR